MKAKDETEKRSRNESSSLAGRVEGVNLNMKLGLDALAMIWWSGRRLPISNAPPS
jgi:hypothetical protein